MTKYFYPVSVIVLFAVFCFASAKRSVGVAQEQTPVAHVKWEYCFMASDKPVDLENFNSIGEEGWELVSSVAYPQEGNHSQVYHCFKRRLP